MPTDHTADPWSGTTYNGFSAAPPPGATKPAAARRLSTRTLVIGGVAAAAILGVGLGLFSRPSHLNLGDGPARAPMQAVTPPAAAGPTTSGQVQIAVNAPPPEALPDAGRLNVLPPGVAHAPSRPPALANPAANPAGADTQAPPQPLVIAPASIPTPAPQVAAPPIVDVPPAPRLRASFDCATARPGAERMVCSDPQLAAADRELARAWRRALNSGAPPEDLRDEQRDWLAIREDAARHSPRALASVYDQRIDELNQIADDGPSN